MTRLRISGSRTETRRRAPGTAIATTVAASFAVFAIGCVSFLAPGTAALAQTAGTSGPVSLGELFKPASPDLRDGAQEKLREAGGQTLNPGGCAEKAKFKALVKRSNDPLLDTALGQARRDVLNAALADSPLSGRFEFSYEIASRDDVQVDYDRMPDKEPPKLHTSSVPPKGSKVKPGDPIKVTMVARDDATTWQTGIQRIQLIAQNPGGDAQVGAQDYPPVIRANCEGRPEPRTLVLTYTVPSNPPPIIRLRAITEDFVNLSDFDIAEFPTGDWYGTFGWTHICVGGGNRDETRGISDLTLDYDGRGNLTGTLTGSTPQRAQTVPSCTFKYVAPGTFSAKLVGTYTPGQNTFSVEATNVQTRPGRASWTCPSGGGDVIDQAFFTVYEGPMFRDAFRDLRRQQDGSWKLIPDGESTHSAGGGTCTTTYSLTLRQAQN